MAQPGICPCTIPEKSLCVQAKGAPALTWACSARSPGTFGRWGRWRQQDMRTFVIKGEHFSPVLMWSSVWYACGWRWAEGKGVSSQWRQQRAMRSSEPKALLTGHWQRVSSWLAFPGVLLCSHKRFWYWDCCFGHTFENMPWEPNRRYIIGQEIGDLTLRAAWFPASDDNLLTSDPTRSPKTLCLGTAVWAVLLPLYPHPARTSLTTASS